MSAIAGTITGWHLLLIILGLLVVIVLNHLSVKRNANVIEEREETWNWPVNPDRPTMEELTEWAFNHKEGAR